MGGNYVNGKCRPFVVTRVLVGIMRPGGEVFLLKWEYIDWHTRTIFIPFGKTANARRRVAMTQRTAEALLARMPKKAEGWVFPSKRSKSGHITTVAKAFGQAREDAGLPKSLVLYCASHTFGIHAPKRTGHLSAVMKAMGYSSPQVTMVYLHPGLDAIRAAMENKYAETLQRRKLRHNPGEGSPEQHASR